MARITSLFSSPGPIGLVCNVGAVWALLAASIWLLSRTGSDFGAPSDSSRRDAPWTPPGAVIGAIWFLLYTLMATSLWVLNRLPSDIQPGLKLGVYILIGFCLVWPFYAFSQTSRLPGLIGNLGIMLISVFAVWRLSGSSTAAALLITPVAVWITVATATILDGARRYGW